LADELINAAKGSSNSYAIKVRCSAIANAVLMDPLHQRHMTLIIAHRKRMSSSVSPSPTDELFLLGPGWSFAIYSFRHGPTRRTEVVVVDAQTCMLLFAHVIVIVCAIRRILVLALKPSAFVRCLTPKVLNLLYCMSLAYLALIAHPLALGDTPAR
jgi:hypothetical protein